MEDKLFAYINSRGTPVNNWLGQGHTVPQPQVQLCPQHYQQLHQKLHLHLQVLRLGTHSPAAAGQDEVPGQGRTAPQPQAKVKSR